MYPGLHIHASSAALFEGVTRRIIEIGNEALAARGEFHLALAGGATPRTLYRCLATPPMQQRLDWSRVHLWFGDERCVPPDDAQSNYRMVRESLMERLPLPPGQIHRMEGERAPQEAAQRYTDAMTILPRNGGSVPIFDLILLGLGPDGHIASLFPNTSALQTLDRPVTALHVPQLESWRLTLTLPVLNCARHLLVMVSGAKKADVIRHIFCAPRSAELLPVQLLKPEPEALEWYLDQEAARYIHCELTP